MAHCAIVQATAGRGPEPWTYGRTVLRTDFHAPELRQYIKRRTARAARRARRAAIRQELIGTDATTARRAAIRQELIGTDATTARSGERAYWEEYRMQEDDTELSEQLSARLAPRLCGCGAPALPNAPWCEAYQDILDEPDLWQEQEDEERRQMWEDYP